MATPESNSPKENITDHEPDIRRERVKEIIAYHIGLCRRLGMDPNDNDSLIGVNHSLRQEHLLTHGQSFLEVYPGALEEVLNPSNTEPTAEVIRLRDHQTTTPPPRHSPAA